MTVICAILLYRLGHQKKFKRKQVREKDKKKIINSNAIVHDSISK